MDGIVLIAILVAIYVVVVAMGVIVYCVTNYKNKADKLTEILKEKEADYKEKIDALEKAELDLKTRQDTLLEEENILRLEKEAKSDFENMSEKELTVELCQKFDRNKLVVDHIFERVINVKEYSQDLKALKEDTLDAGKKVEESMRASSEETIKNMNKNSSDMVEELRKATKENNTTIKNTVDGIEKTIDNKIKENMVSKDTMDTMMVNAVKNNVPDIELIKETVKSNVPDIEAIKSAIDAAKPEPFVLDENIIKNSVREVVLEVCTGEQMEKLVESTVRKVLSEQKRVG